MALLYSEMKKRMGEKAKDFSLLGVDEKKYSLSSFKDSKALVVAFICNHCPYVQAVDDRINDLAKEYQNQGVSLIGINPNLNEKYPDDSFPNMKIRHHEKGFVFPYVMDETQEVAKEYGAVCTPDFFVYENQGGDFLLRYQGRLDDSWKDPKLVTQRELAHALDEILQGRAPDIDSQKPSMGCSIKWK